MRQLPPGLTSILSAAVSNLDGPHHFGMRSGSLETLKTSSRGASKIRSQTISRPDGIVNVVVPLFLVSMVLTLSCLSLARSALAYRPNHARAMPGGAPDGANREAAPPASGHTKRRRQGC